MSEILKTQIGRTPLVRALKLEKDLGVSKIFLKLEGNNPYGHREDRLAYLIIREALSQQKDTICIGTVGTVGYSLAQLSEHYPSDVYSICMSEIRKQATEANNRDLYKHVCSNIKLLVEFGARSEADVVINELKSRYPRRPAMLEELEDWMDRKEYKSIDEFRGILSSKAVNDPFVYKRAQYIDMLLKSEEHFNAVI